MKFNPMQRLQITYGIILALGITAYFSEVHYFANIAGFIGAIGLMYVFFKDRPALEEGSAEYIAAEKMRRLWYTAFGTGIVFSLILGSLWNHKMGAMVGG